MNSFECTLSWIQRHWNILAYGSSIFWGFRGAYLFTGRIALKNDPQFGKIENWIIFRILRFLLWSIYQFIFNFVGSLAGWGCLYLLTARIQVAAGSYTQLTLSWSDCGLFFFSVLGLTGHLPQALYGLVVSLGNLADIAVKKTISSTG